MFVRMRSTGIIEVLDGVRRTARLFSLVVKRKPEVSIPDFGYHLNTWASLCVCVSFWCQGIKWFWMAPMKMQGFLSLVLDLGVYGNSPVLVSSFRRLHLRVKVHGVGTKVSIQVLAWIRFAIEA
jgi:hypothetical protein